MQFQNRISQTGFGLTMVLVGIMAVVVMGGSGYLVYHHAHKAKTPVADTVTTSNNSSSTQSTTGTTAQPAQSSSQYLSISQWGIEFPLAGDISDAYYVVPVGSQGSDGEPGEVDISLTSRNGSCGKLTADPAGQENDLVAITRSQVGAIDSYTGEPITQLEPVGATIGGWYYGFADAYLKSKTSSCISKGDIQSLDSSFGTAVKQAIATSTNE